MQEETAPEAPGWPGSPARWTSSAKVGVGTALSPTSRVWFTLSHGILNEIYYPRVDQACTRDLGLIVTDGEHFFSEEKRHTEHETKRLAEGVPAFHLVNTCEQGRYRIEKQVLSDPWQDTVLQHVTFKALQGQRSDYHLYVLLAPHLNNQGAGNTAWIAEHKGVAMLFAQRGATTLALACSAPWLHASAGFVGTSDGWQDLDQHKRLTWAYPRATNGNVALTAEIDLRAGDSCTLALGFGFNAAEAGHRALTSLVRSFHAIKTQYIREWQTWLQGLEVPDREAADGSRLFAISAGVLRTHESKTFPGAIIASLAIPWGFDKGDHDLGGYHLIWPRDMVEAAGGLLAAGLREDACRALHYLQASQEKDGHWPQNMWVDGTAYWNGLQLDETALPILLAGLAYREQALDDDDVRSLWPVIHRAASYIVRNGPVTQQDRWEEDPGYTAFTLGAEIAALLVAADLAEGCQEADEAAFLRETADAWNASIERWTYAEGTDWARQVGVDGYYVRIAPPLGPGDVSPLAGTVQIKNRPLADAEHPASAIVSPDALALVRFGLRAADDPRIVNTVKVIDALLKVETPAGPAWHRYNEDGYGEHADGSPYDGTGIGRLWPLLTGERAHYELAAGRRDVAEHLRQTMVAFANEGQMLSEQIWDSHDIPDAALTFGCPSGSAMPLVWAHAEYVKLCRSLEDNRVFDLPPQTVQRYLVDKQGSPHIIWRFNNKTRTLPAGKTLRVELQAPAVVHWSTDGWQTSHDTNTRDTELGIHLVDLPTGDLAAGTALVFTFCWPGADRWEGTDFTVAAQ